MKNEFFEGLKNAMKGAVKDLRNNKPLMTTTIKRDETGKIVYRERKLKKPR